MEQTDQDVPGTAQASKLDMVGATSPFTQALMAGAFAGTAVDLSLYPIDTLKTRLQSAAGFRASGGFRGIYAGIGSVALGAAPGAALFFVSYESSKSFLSRLREERTRARTEARSGAGRTFGSDDAWQAPFEHMAAASLGEVAACAIRVPTEVVKQRAQAGAGTGAKGSSMAALMAILSQRPAIGLAGVWRELYRGWGITVMREVPFTVVQFPLWEAMKSRWVLRQRRRHATTMPEGRGNNDIGALESGLFGSAAGAVAAAVTTPLDVLKTRMMLATNRVSVREILADVLKTNGARGLLAGIGPRVAWISAGGAVFLGSYQWAYNLLGS